MDAPPLFFDVVVTVFVETGAPNQTQVITMHQQFVHYAGDTPTMDVVKSHMYARFAAMVDGKKWRWGDFIVEEIEQRTYVAHDETVRYNALVGNKGPIVRMRPRPGANTKSE